TVSGYEASVYYDVGWAFANLNVNVFEEPFNLPTQAAIDQPEYAGTLTLGTRWFDERLVLGGRMTFFGEPSLELDIPNETFTTFYWEAEEIFDLFGSYQVNDNLALRFSVENVADTYYVAPVYGSNIPAPGRTVRASATATF
ncbi:MAG: TonB-dependent receptor, partial [Hyphomicrobiales bacterium]|nr:TonB-dependent receptor [Hyphomicrobiales bacterium]